MRTHSGVLISSVPSRSSLSVHTSDGLRHSYFRIVASLVNQYSGSHLTFSSYTMLFLVFHRLVEGSDSDVIAEDHHKYYKFISLH